MKNTDDKHELEKFIELISKIDAKEFTGYTSFDRLTPEQKLLWLSQSAQFFFWAKKIRDTQKKP